MSRTITVVLAALCLAVCIALPQAAQAQDQCAELETNEQWNEGIKKVNDLINAEKYDEALVLSREIYSICPRSPLLNYFVAQCLKNTGDPVKATQFYQTASDNTYTIATPPQTSQKIWYARYESEYPERSGENVKTLQDKTEALEARKQEIERKLASTNVNQDSAGDAIALWTGVGIGAAGLALGATGIALLATSSKDDRVDGDYFKPSYAAFWGMAGAGIALTAAGTIMAGIFGYRYTHTAKHSDVAFSLSPNAASLTFKF